MLYIILGIILLLIAVPLLGAVLSLGIYVIGALIGIAILVLLWKCFSGAVVYFAHNIWPEIAANWEYFALGLLAIAVLWSFLQAIIKLIYKGWLKKTGFGLLEEAPAGKNAINWSINQNMAVKVGGKYLISTKLRDSLVQKLGDLQIITTDDLFNLCTPVMPGFSKYRVKDLANCLYILKEVFPCNTSDEKDKPLTLYMTKSLVNNCQQALEHEGMTLAEDFVDNCPEIKTCPLLTTPNQRLDASTAILNCIVRRNAAKTIILDNKETLYTANNPSPDTKMIKVTYEL